MCEWSTIARSPTGAPRSGTAYRQEVQRPLQVGVRRHPEVRRRDRRDEPRVERLGQPERRMQAIPARSQRERVRAQLPGVEDPEDLHPGEVREEQLPVLLERVLTEM